MSSIQLKSCLTSNTNTNTSNSTVLHVKELLTPACLLVLSITIILATVILIALILSKCYRSPNAILYFNVSLTDFAMAFVCIFMFLPLGSVPWELLLYFAMIVGVLRPVWSLTAMLLMINRYNLIRGKLGFGINFTYVAVTCTWIAGLIQSLYWFLRSPGRTLAYFGSTIQGVVLDNLFLVVGIFPFPTVIIYFSLTISKAREHISTIESQDDLVSRTNARQMWRGLKLLFWFGAVYVVGFALEFVVDVNSLINLSGYLDIVPLWESNPVFCQYLLGTDEVANLLINLSNSLIIVQSRHVQAALRRVFQATTRVVRNARNVSRDQSARIPDNAGSDVEEGDAE